MRLWRALVVWLLLALPVAAQDQPAPQVLIINSDRLYLETLYGRRLAADLQAQVDAFQQENDRIAATLVEEERSLTQRRPSMTPEAFRAEAEAFHQKAQDVRRARTSQNVEFQETSNQYRAQFEARTQGIIANVMLERGATMVMEEANVRMSVRSANITDEVIARIDAALGDGAE